MIDLLFYCELSFQILKQHEGKQFLHEIFKDYLYIFNQFYHNVMHGKLNLTVNNNLYAKMVKTTYSKSSIMICSSLYFVERIK